MVIGVLIVYCTTYVYRRVPMNVPVPVQLILLKKFNLERSTFYALLREVYVPLWAFLLS